MTHDLSRAWQKVVRQMESQQSLTEEPQMSDTTCPWCEAELVLEIAPREAGQTCPECLTSWSYVDEPVEWVLAAAA